MSPILIFLFALSCEGCACFTPSLPDAGDSGEVITDTEDTADTGETGETGETGPIDTAPPPPCAQPEVEPNDYSNPQPIVLERRACGDFGSALDFDVFELEVDYGEWLLFDIDSQNLGRPTDVAMLVADPDGNTAIGGDSPDSNDPYLLVPVLDEGTWQVVLYEFTGDGGEDFLWEMMPTISKAPTEWDREEAGDNDDFDDAEPITEDEVVFGFVESGDVDNFRYTTPEGKHQITISIEAADLGSPLVARLVLNQLETNDTGGQYWSQLVTTQGSTNQTFGLDPEIVYTSEGGDVWNITVREDDIAGDLYWYTVKITAEAAAGTE